MRFTKHKSYALLLIMVSLLVFGARPLIFHSSAASLPNRNLTLDDSRQGASTRYTFDFDLVSPSAIGSIRFEFCSDTPLINQPCAFPNGFSSSGATLADQQGITGFTVASGSPANTVTLTRSSSVVTPGHVSFAFDDVVSPTSVGTYYARIQTYASTDATGADTDSGGLAFSTSQAIDISATVPPFLLACNGVTIAAYDCTTATGDYINFGELSPSTVKSAKTEIVIATNASNGYSLQVDGPTLASGTDVIPAVTSRDVSRPGTSQFAINLAANASPAIGDNPSGPGAGTVTGNYATPDRFAFIPGDTLASSPAPSDYRKYTISYIVNMNKTQPSGIYVSTLSFVSLANF